MCVHSKSLALAGAGIARSVCVCVWGGWGARGLHQFLWREWLNDPVLPSPEQQQSGLTQISPRHSSVLLLLFFESYVH